VLLDDFDDVEGGGVFTTSAAHGDALRRHKATGDHPGPSATSLAATVWAELARWEPLEPRWRGRAAAALSGLADGNARFPTHFAQAAIALDELTREGGELVVVAPAGTPPGQPLLDAAAPFLPDPARGLHPGLVVAFGREGDDHPALAGRTAIDGRTTAYVCRGMACDAPTSDPAVARAAVDLVRGSLDGPRRR
jgi:uncharacterized protein YyaL (SSP411 family)